MSQTKKDREQLVKQKLLSQARMKASEWKMAREMQRIAGVLDPADEGK